MEKKKIKKKCACCGYHGFLQTYKPISRYYEKMNKKYNTVPHKAEFLNRKEYFCRRCGASDRDRMICAILKLLNLPKADNSIRLLQIAPSRAIENWIIQNCPNLTYESTDLMMENVTFRTDIQDMSVIADNTYDYFICSHVLEHVEDDQKAIRELARILKPNGIGIFLVPVCMDLESIEEEWGLSEEENWRRFGQNDHCRNYSKKGLIERLSNNGFYVHIFDCSNLKNNIFIENGLTATSALYILSKTESDTKKMMRRCTDTL